jgi:hypothetical protein
MAPFKDRTAGINPPLAKLNITALIGRWFGDEEWLRANPDVGGLIK